MANPMASEHLAELMSKAQVWLSQDPDNHTRTQLESLVTQAPNDPAALAELTDAFIAPLEFGTAGLRGKLGAGPNRMNRVVVIQTAAGLAQYLIDTGHSGESVVIGYDGRHNSDVFARDSAAVLAGAGLIPLLFEHVVPTPVLAFAIRELNTCAGIMVTASHNPPQDNGYKVYLGDGRQIVTPADEQIAQCIRAITDVTAVPRSDVCHEVPSFVMDRYVSSLSSAIHSGPTRSEERSDVVSVYTAMHGVGWATLREAFVACDFKEPIAVIAQRDPDPDFPTVAFPNPEEKGALDLAIAQANDSHAEVLIANDPDADRLAVALPIGNGGWKTLHGDQVGCLLAWWVLERANRSGVILDGVFGSSVVSSMLLERIAQDANLKYSQTLTGFKWISRVPGLVYGYEEALGYCVNPEFVGDKDGISAATFILEMMAALKSEGRTPWDVLDDLARKYGLHSSAQVSVKVSDMSLVPQIMGRLRSSPPQTLGRFAVSQIVDLQTPDSGLPPTDGVILHLAGDSDILRARVIVRPSGTEPKIKCYLEVVSALQDVADAEVSNEAALLELSKDSQPLLLI
ncbi:unannotated protein [freshwater metagenome]|uniref:Unannotated protein n=1 Tax=freshwater metagenome TaxID=449393 RepID=A0A6J5ZQK4_9ZZZZ